MCPVIAAVGGMGKAGDVATAAATTWAGLGRAYIYVLGWREITAGTNCADVHCLIPPKTKAAVEVVGYVTLLGVTPSPPTQIK